MTQQIPPRLTQLLAVSTGLHRFHIYAAIVRLEIAADIEELMQGEDIWSEQRKITRMILTSRPGLHETRVHPGETTQVAESQVQSTAGRRHRRYLRYLDRQKRKQQYKGEEHES